MKHCNICRWKGSEFDSTMINFGWVGEKKPRAVCPNCQGCERHRLLVEYITSLKERIKIGRCLEIGPHPKFKLVQKALDENTEYISIDKNPKRALYKMDVQEMTFDSEEFDLIVCSHVLYAVKNDKKALSEIYRILKPLGIAAIQVIHGTIDQKGGEETIEFNEPNKGRAYRNYGSDIVDRFIQAGFFVSVPLFSSKISDMYGFGGRIIHECRKVK